PAPYVVPPTKEFDGNDGSWSSFTLSIGTPGQDFRVLASTKSGSTFVVVPDGCGAEGDGEDCPNRRGAEVFRSTQSPGYQVEESSSWSLIGTYGVDLENNINPNNVSGLFGYDKVALAWASENTNVSLDGQVVVGIAEPDYYMGHIPLGVPDASFSSSSDSVDPFLLQLRNASKIPSLSFGYTAGAKYRLKSVPGNLVLGGYDSTRFEPNKEDFSFTLSTDPSKMLTVGVASIMGQNTLKGTFSLTIESHFSLVDSTVPELWLPKKVCDNFEAVFGLTYDEKTDRYLVNDTMHEKLKSLDPSITIKLVNSLEATSTNYTNIKLPYAAFDLQASAPIYDTPTNYFPIRRAANDSQYVLGRTFLQEAYIIVDYERANFTISQAVFPNPLPAQKIVTISSYADSSKKKPSSDKSALSTGTIAGIAAGGGLLLILVLVGAFYLTRKRRGKREKYELANTQLSEAGSTGRRIEPLKQPMDPQELGGTPLTELASPRYGYASDQKPFLGVQDEPQELPTPHTNLSPTTPRWREV
ncbi:acid protease, partial [Amniculicola lignicola CBS 123094]